MLQYYPFFWGDYAAKTAGLSQSQNGAYMLFLKHIYCTGEKIHDKEKYRVAMAFNEEERQAADFILTKFFKLDNSTGAWDHEKCRDVIAKAEATHKSAAERGAAGGKTRAENRAKKLAEAEESKGEGGNEFEQSEAELQAELRKTSSSATSSASSNQNQTQIQTPEPQRINLKSLSQTLSQVAKPEIPDNLKEELGEMKPIGHFLGFSKQGFGDRGFGIGGEKKLTEAEQVATIQAGTAFVNNLSDSAKQRARANAPSWDLVFLAAKYIEGIASRGMPEKGYNAAFPAWCLKYTKGKRP
jgi:uncharacterized protein YdaU (DUF1376 family)